MKKGFAADQARWIFIVIAGGVIFLFLFRVLAAGSAQTDTAVAANLASVITAVATGISGDSSETIQLPEQMTIEYDCTSRMLRVNGAQQLFSGDAIVFMPSMQTSQLVIRVVEYQIPFTAARVVFIADDISRVQVSDIKLQAEQLVPEQADCGLQRVAARSKLTITHMIARIQQPDMVSCHGAYTGTLSSGGNALELLQDYANAADFAELETKKNSNTVLLNRRNDQVIGASCPAIY